MLINPGNMGTFHSLALPSGLGLLPVTASLFRPLMLTLHPGKHPCKQSLRIKARRADPW